MGASRVDALVVGAGFSGLAAAVELRRLGLEVVVLERAERPGGVVRSERVAGYLLERGPNTVLVKAAMAAFLKRHGLDEKLQAARPASRLRFVVRNGRLLPVPLGPWSMLRTPLLSTRGKFRVLAEPVVRRGDPSGESVAAFVARRFGSEVVERLVGPFLSGIYAGDERQLGAEAVFPALVEAERRSGSVVRGLLRRGLSRRAPRAWRGSWSTSEGLEGLARALAGLLGPSLRLGSQATEIVREGHRFVVATETPNGGERVEAAALVLALPAREAARLLRSLDGELAKELAGIAYAPVVSLSLGVDPQDVRERIEGFGFLVPRQEGQALLGCLFPSQLFPDRAPEGRELLTALLGGTRGPKLLERSDAELEACAHRELDRFLGLRSTPQLLALTCWPHAVAQPGRDHPRLLPRVRHRLSAFPGLVLAGSYLNGVAIADAVESGIRAAQAIRKL